MQKYHSLDCKQCLRIKLNFLICHFFSTQEQVKASEVLHGETVCVEDNLPMSDSDSSLDSCSSWELLYEDDEEKKSSQKESHNQEHSKNKYVCKRQRKEVRKFMYKQGVRNCKKY